MDGLGKSKEGTDLHTACCNRHPIPLFFQTPAAKPALTRSGHNVCKPFHWRSLKDEAIHTQTRIFPKHMPNHGTEGEMQGIGCLVYNSQDNMVEDVAREVCRLCS